MANESLVKAPPRPMDLSEKALSVPAKTPADLRALFANPLIIGQLQKAIPKHLTVDRLLKVAVSSITKTPQLLQCTQLSLVQSVMMLGELGLEAGGALGLGYLVPFLDKKTNRLICTPIIGYRGFIDLARRSGTLSQIEARCVRERDKLDMCFGLTPRFEHTPSQEEDPGETKLVYCIARFKDGGVHVEVMSCGEVEGIRKRSKAATSGPWVSDWDEMAKKTVMRRAAKWLPLSPEMARALEIDDEQFVDASNVLALPSRASQPKQLEASTQEVGDASAADGAAPPHDPVTGEVLESQSPPATPEVSQAQPEGDDPVTQAADAFRARIMAATAPFALQELAGGVKDFPPAERASLQELYTSRMKELRGAGEVAS